MVPRCIGNNRNDISFTGGKVLIQSRGLLCRESGTELLNGCIITLFAFCEVCIIDAKQIG